MGEFVNKGKEPDQTSSALVRFRPGPPKSNNALLRAGHFLFGVSRVRRHRSRIS